MTPGYGGSRKVFYSTGIPGGGEDRTAVPPPYVNEEKERRRRAVFILWLLGGLAGMCLVGSLTPAGRYLRMVLFPVSIMVRSIPEGARIYIDGRDTGSLTPGRVVLSPGACEVGLTRAGFMPLGTTDTAAGEAFTLNLARGRNTAYRDGWRFIAESADKGCSGELTGLLKRRVSLRSTPPGAQVYIGSAAESAGETALDVGLAPGEIPVRLVKPGCAPLERTLKVAATGKTEFSFALVPEKGAARDAEEAGEEAEETPLPEYTAIRLDMEHWLAYSDQGVQSRIEAVGRDDAPMLEMEYDMGSGQWLGVYRNEIEDFADAEGMRFAYLWEGQSNTLEFKLVDGDGTNYGATYRIRGVPGSWNMIDVPKERLRYWWGGNDELDWERVTVHFAVSRKNGAPGGEGKVRIRDFQVY